MNLAFNYSIALLTTLYFAAGCQKQGISYDGQNVHNTLSKLTPNVNLPTLATPIDLPDVLGEARNFYQTRSVITLDISSDQIGAANTLELDNETTNKTLIQQTALSLTQEGEPTPYALTDQGFTITLSIYPLDPNYANKFAYGLNKLRLNLNEQTKPEYSENSITLQDFTFFGVGSTVFLTPGQRQSGFQGRVSSIVGPITSNGQNVLTTGLIGMSNW